MAINEIPRPDVEANREGMPQEAGANLPLVLGRVVQSPKYGRGYVTEIEEDGVRVRFWRHGYKRFRRIDAGYPFKLIDEVRTVKRPAEGLQHVCQHGKWPHFCCKCAGLPDHEIEKWKPYRTTARPIIRIPGTNRYIDVRVSRNDCVLTSRPEKSISKSEISDWLECEECGRISEVPKSKNEPNHCPHCNGAVVPIAEPFQRTQFAPDIKNGAEEQNYADVSIPARTRHTEEEEIKAGILRELYRDPNSRFQEGGTGYLRIPLDEPRSTRADAPEWLDWRKIFLQTLKNSRSERAERILYGYYVDRMTDRQIAEAVGWATDSVKKERKLLVEQGNEFFLGAPNTPLAPL